MIIRLTIQHDAGGFRATISKRNAQSNSAIGTPEVFFVADKEEARNRVKEVARRSGLKTYRVVDKTLKIQPAGDGRNRPDSARE
jgi:hypothetical protein